MNDLKAINPAASAIVMAIGIFLYAAMEAFPFLGQGVGEVFTVVFVIVGLVIYTLLARQLFDKKFIFMFLHHSVNFFVLGAWIAGGSVLSKVIIKYFPELSAWVYVFMLANTLFWIMYIVGCVLHFRRLWKRPMKYFVHGIILLATVSTQSLVIVWVELYPNISSSILISAISLGLLFYIVGILLISSRYGFHKQWSLTEDWVNTNCIIHGALSITGMALVSSQLTSARFIMFFWLLVFMLLVFVEVLEVVRAVKRVGEFGWKKGIFTYHVSQWSRNFTFGMFYAFTLTMHENPYYKSALYSFHERFLTLWVWIVFIVLTIEICFWIVAKQRILFLGNKKGYIE